MAQACPSCGRDEPLWLVTAKDWLGRLVQRRICCNRCCALVAAEMCTATGRPVMVERTLNKDGSDHAPS